MPRTAMISALLAGACLGAPFVAAAASAAVETYGQPATAHHLANLITFEHVITFEPTELARLTAHHFEPAEFADNPDCVHANSQPYTVHLRIGQILQT